MASSRLRLVVLAFGRVLDQRLIKKLRCLVRLTFEILRQHQQVIRELQLEGRACGAFEENWSDRMADPLFQTIDRGEVEAAPLIEAAANKLSGSSVY